MSSYETGLQDGEVATLAIQGPIGVRITVLDGEFAERATGTVSLAVPLPRGLYLVQWSGGGAQEQKVVSLVPGELKQLPMPGLPDRVLDPEGIDATRSISAHSENSNYGRLVVTIDGGDAQESLRSLKLVRFDEPKHRFRASKEETPLTEEGGVHPDAAVYDLNAGIYRLEFRTPVGEVVNQTVAIFAGRDTLMALQSASMNVLGSGSDAAFTPKRGIDATATAVVSVAREVPLAEHGDRLRIADQLLKDLEHNNTSLGGTLMARLHASDDPLLRLYAAVLIACRVAAGLPAALQEVGSSTQHDDAQWWMKSALELIETAPGIALPSDFQIVRWNLDRLRGHLCEPPRITTPPMLAACLDWLNEFQMHEDKPSFSMLAARKGPIAASAWLVWRPSAGKAGVIDKQQSGGRDFAIEPLSSRVSVDEIVSLESEPGFAGSNGADPFDDAPVRRRPILHPDDPQRGRFGGLSNQNGFRLAAHFGPVRDDHVEATLTIHAPQSLDGQSAWLFLHDTFQPQETKAYFHGKRCQIDLRIWGGFTVGAWLPVQGIELELNLASLVRAPSIVRNR